jgi:hypothetical protein
VKNLLTKILLAFGVTWVGALGVVAGDSEDDGSPTGRKAFSVMPTGSAADREALARAAAAAAPKGRPKGLGAVRAAARRQAVPISPSKSPIGSSPKGRAPTRGRAAAASAAATAEEADPSASPTTTTVAAESNDGDNPGDSSDDGDGSEAGGNSPKALVVGILNPIVATILDANPRFKEEMDPVSRSGDSDAMFLVIKKYYDEWKAADPNAPPLMVPLLPPAVIKALAEAGAVLTPLT